MKIGLTGGIGSGKSMVAQILEKMGYPVFYADDAAKHLWATDLELQGQLTQLVGFEVFREGILQKELLAKWIFSNENHRNLVNQLIHPRVRNAFDAWALKQSKHMVFNEAAILFETEAYRRFDKTILVTAPEQLKMKRIQERDQLAIPEIQKRMAAQWSDEQKSKLADFIIINDEQTFLVPQIERMLQSFSLGKNDSF